ncbi:hypothetical protein NL676_033689 [Syzygium grande]|nr:hypothetical protein NL676_033689 [Syzygium grande]
MTRITTLSKCILADSSTVILTTGTVDFIFRNTAAVLQNCSIRPRQPMASQSNIIRAQGKSDPKQNMGFTIRNCRIGPLNNLTA